jgi:hypothetical protein
MPSPTTTANMNRIASHLDKSPRSLGSVVLASFFRMRALCIHVDLSSSPLLGNADLLWHDFILDTRKYSEFCAEFPGGFLHHCPRTGTASSIEETEGKFITAYLSPDFEDYHEPEIDQFIRNKVANKSRPVTIVHFHECG